MRSSFPMPPLPGVLVLVALLSPRKRRAPRLTLAGLLLAVLAGPANAQQAGAPGARGHALLVGCTRYDNLPESSWLVGPVHDVALMRTLLTARYHFSPEGIVTLAEGEGEDLRPTRANIQREFERLAGKARQGDQLVILLSGHGSQQPDQDPPDPEDPEPDGLDETFLPADVGSWDRGTERVANAIIDDEVRAWLKPIERRGARIWIIFDSCHSGTMIRGNGTEVLRRVPAESLVPAEALRNVRRRAERVRVTPDSSPLDVSGEDADLVAIYGAQPDESELELPLPPRAVGARRYGLLTYTMSQILTEARSRLTYRQLVQRVHTQYVAWGRGYPTPLLEGADQDRFVLDAERDPKHAPYVLRRSRGGWELNAGALHGLTAGTILAVSPEPDQADAGTVVGHVRVTPEGLLALTAAVEPCAYGSMSTRGDLPERGQCRPVFIDYGDMRLKIAVDDIAGLGATADAKNPVRPPAAERRRLEAMLREVAREPGSLIEMVTDPARADWLVRMAGPGSDQVCLVPGSGWPLDAGPGGLPPLFGPLAAERETLKDRLARIARAQHLRQIAGEPGPEPLEDDEMDVQVELLRFAGMADRDGQVVAWQARGIEFREGEILGFRVANRGRVPVDVTVLFIDSGFGIKPFFPRVAGADNRLTTSPTRAALTRRFRVSAGTVGLENLVVIAVKAREEENPVDFGFLAQETIPLARDYCANRSGEGQTIDSPLGRLLQRAVYGEGSVRGLEVPTLDDYVLRMLTWRTVAGKRATGPKTP